MAIADRIHCGAVINFTPMTSQKQVHSGDVTIPNPTFQKKSEMVALKSGRKHDVTLKPTSEV